MGIGTLRRVKRDGVTTLEDLTPKEKPVEEKPKSTRKKTKSESKK